MITLNGGAGSKGRMAYSCTYFSMFLCFYVPHGTQRTIAVKIALHVNENIRERGKTSLLCIGEPTICHTALMKSHATVVAH